MALRMKSACERCTESLPEQAEAFICSYECTFCSDCAARMSLRCPNRGGELVRRPRRERSSGESRQG